MKTKVITKGALCYIRIENFFDPATLLNVHKELKYLKNFIGDAKFTNAAKDDSGRYLKTGFGVFADKVYEGIRSSSPILTGCNNLFNNIEIGKKAESKNAFFGHIDKSDRDFTLVNFYSPGQEYEPHKDTTTITAITFLKIGSFTGGDFVFTDYDERIPFEENLTIVFPGCVTHQAEPIHGDRGAYRVSVVQFLGYM
jgi:hypothetical protein